LSDEHERNADVAPFYCVLSIARDCGGSYFAGYGDWPGPMWRNFLDRLETASITAAAQNNFGATATFACPTS
jgi:heme oxygenase